MKEYFANIFQAVWTTLVGLKVTLRQIFDRAVTHQYPYEKKFEQKAYIKWGSEKKRNNRREIHEGYRGKLENRVEDCIGCTSCVRECPVGCVTVETERAERGEDLGETRNVVHLNDGSTIVGIVEEGEDLAEGATVNITDMDGQAHSFPASDVKSIIARRKKRMRISTYGIDMSLCMFCGLCVESCPTECLTMTKEFAFSTYKLEDLIYGFVQKDKVVADVMEEVTD